MEKNEIEKRCQEILTFMEELPRVDRRALSLSRSALVLVTMALEAVEKKDEVEAEVALLMAESCVNLMKPQTRADKKPEDDHIEEPVVREAFDKIVSGLKENIRGGASPRPAQPAQTQGNPAWKK